MKCPIFTKEQLHIFDSLPSGVLVNVFDDDDTLMYAYSNSYLANSLGYDHEEFEQILKENCFAAIYEADRKKTQLARESVMEGKIVDSMSRQKRKDGSFMWILAHIRQIELDGRIGMLFLFSRIQELIGLQNELHAKNEEWSDIMNSVPIGMMVFKIEKGITTTLSVNRFMLDFANRVGTLLDSKQREWKEAEFSMLINQNIYSFCEYEDIPIAKKMIQDSETNSITSCVFRLNGSSEKSEVYIYATCVSKPSGDDGRTYYVTFQNVTEAEHQRQEILEKQEQLYEKSYYDALTGVKNRNAYNDYTKHCRKKRIYNVGFAFCDINGLKQTNDTLGHYYGDQLIVRFADILKEYFASDYIYRLSGDEFVIIHPDIERTDFQKRMGQLIERVQSEDNIASIGYAWKLNVSDIQRRTTQVEQIMYVEKQNYYDANRAIKSKHRPRFVETLLKEFDEGRFVMYLQPKTSIDGNKVIGAEALVRKITLDGNIVAPHEFVPQLEHERLIPKLDYYMLQQVCGLLQEQHELGNDDFSVSVNLSRVTIVENDFIKTVESILNRYRFERKNLDFEVTESTKTMDAIRLEEYLIQLKALGIKISLDDMGTDYSSLTLLTLDGLDWVKLDRSLVIQIGQRKANILLKHAISMCHDLDIKVIAEGVENDEERQMLMEMGCDAYQGYLTSEPIPIGEFKERFLK